MLSFRTLAQRVARNLHIPVTGEYVDRQIKQFINRTYRETWDMELWPQLITAPTSLTITSGNTSFTLPKHISQIVRAYNPTTFLNYSIRVLGMPEFSDATALTTEPGEGLLEIAPYGPQGVLVQLASTQLVKAKSSSASDTTALAIQVLIKGLDSNSELYAEAVTLNGTTAVATTAQFSEIHSVSKNKNTAGQILILDNAAAVTQATIGPFEQSPVYATYRINQTLTSSMTFTYVGKRRFQPLINNLDIPFLDMDVALESGATALGFMENRDPANATIWVAKHTADLDELRRRELNMGEVKLMAPAERA